MLRRSDGAAELLGNAHQLLDLRHSAHFFRAGLVPQVVFGTATHMQAHGNAHHVDRQHIEHRAFHRQHRTIRHGAHKVGQAVDIGCVHATANRHPVHHQRALVDAATHQALYRFEAIDVVALEGALDTGFAQAANMLFGPSGLSRHCHFLVGIEDGRVFHRGALDVAHIKLLQHVHLRGVDGHRHLIGLGVQLGQHMTRVIAQPLGGGTVALRRKTDGAAHLNDHLGYTGTHSGNQLIELGQAFAAATIQLTHMQVQHLGASVVAVHRFLNLLFHGDRDLTGKVRWQPGWCVGCRRDDQGLLVFGEQVAVEKIHGVVSVVI